MDIVITKILCPVDFSESSKHALRYALAFAQAYGAELELLHVVEMPFLPSYSMAAIPDLSLPMDRIEEEAKKELEDLLAECSARHDKLKGDVRVGTPFVEIINYAREAGIDLIVVGTHGGGALKHLLIGGTAEKIVRKAPCPVLTVRHPEHEFVMP